MLVCVFLCALAHETAGAACTRCSLRPLIGEGGNLTANLGRNAPRDREVVHGGLPSLHEPLRVVGRGRGWGVYQLAPLAASLLRHPPPPTPKSELRSSRPHRFAGGGEELMAMARCLKIESSGVVPAKAGTHNHRRVL